MNQAPQVWPNNWTPVNRACKTFTATSPSPPLSEPGNENNIPSPFASPLREFILSSAEKMKQTSTARKRKATSPLPITTRKKRATESSLKNNNVELAKSPKLNSKSANHGKSNRAGQEMARITQSGDTSLMPTSQNKLNMQSFSATLDLTTTDLFDRSPFQFNVYPAKPLVVANGRNNNENPDDDDLFDDDDSEIADLLAAEAELAKEQKDSTHEAPNDKSSSFKSLLTQFNLGQVSKTTTVSVSSSKPPPDMKPFLRSVKYPTKIQDKPIEISQQIFSAEYRIPTCFRIAEALRQIHSLNNSDEKSFLRLEIYALLPVNYEYQPPNMPLRFADLFFPDRPPYLIASTTQAMVYKSVSTDKEQSVLSPRPAQNADRVPVHALVLATKKADYPSITASPSGILDKFNLEVLQVKETSWDSIREVRKILDAVVNETKEGEQSTRV
ncbi:hypothetical protein LTR99_006195 [Exophiala xenobiotica]|uniref:Uncharacterized protein n=1 Tax=Vermiconidia calcicola TaxID=1690605 RepID=A0AAV9QBY3_9PEZI|nr:hypothetical protein LTR72_009758 [Exophiala xenobiotica]KAK5533048.1 hypothetical protein LTR23_009345 [Chaetothyriales sp. CCFEE 6169]KAK5537366.1 hypothetical protein LTR25_004617 [Vermiconidia calcicola]KAK5265096.1 hypothetical protein LTR96_009463 [Exophiala xenobiotica]KAK5287511.1 hypothetical protein LTR14_009174 [Exophiala xenobiotica]